VGFELKNIKVKKKEKQFSKIDELLKMEISIGKSFSNKKKEAFYNELYILLSAELTLKESLELIIQQQKNEKDSNRIKNIVDRLIEGKNFSDAIENVTEFSSYEFHSIKIGENTGTLEKIIQELSHFFKRKNEQRRIILSAISYPLVVLFTAFLAIVFMLQFVVPMFADIFRQNKVELPWITKKILSISELFQNYGWLVVVIIASLFIIYQVIKTKQWYKMFTSRIILKIPLLGDFVRKVKMAQLNQALSLLTGARVPLLNALGLTKNMVGFYPIEKAIEGIENDILQGKSLHASMIRFAVFDKKMISLVKVAEETNQNETIFKRLTDQYLQEVEHTSKLLSATLEPMIIVILGVVVAVILIAMYLPMFTLSTVIG